MNGTTITIAAAGAFVGYLLSTDEPIKGRDRSLLWTLGASFATGAGCYGAHALRATVLSSEGPKAGNYALFTGAVAAAAVAAKYL